MDGSRKWVCAQWLAVSGALFAVTGAAPLRAMDAAFEAARPRVAVVAARSGRPDGSSREETGNCLLWPAGGRTYTLGDLHTVMAGAEDASGEVAEQILVRVGTRTSRATLAWPPAGRRDVRQLDIAILELEDGDLGEPFGPEIVEGAAGSLPRRLYLAAPAHRSKTLSIEAPAVAYGSQWFLYRELSPGDSGGMVFALDNGRVVPHGFISSIGSLPGESARGTVLYGRDAMRIFINQFLRARPTAARLQAPSR